MELTPAQIRAARAMLGWSINDLAERVRVHRNTILKAEGGEASGLVLDAIQRAFEDAGVIFIPRNGAGEGLRLAEPTEGVTVLSRKRKGEGTSDA